MTVYPKYKVEIEENKVAISSLEITKELMKHYNKKISHPDDSIYDINTDSFKKTKVKKPKLILQNEKIDIALAIRQLSMYQEQLTVFADITLSRREQQLAFTRIEESKKLQLRLNDVINKLCELER